MRNIRIKNVSRNWYLNRIQTVLLQEVEGGKGCEIIFVMFLGNKKNCFGTKKKLQ